MQTFPRVRTGTARTETGTLRLFDDVEVPFGIIESATPGPCLLVTAGVHGSEFCSVEAAVRLAKTRPDEISGTLVVLPIVNVKGFYKRSIYVMPQDGKNLNRMFPGNPEGTTSERLAHWLVTDVFPQAHAYVDLHGGDLDEGLAPFTIFPQGCHRSEALAAVFGIPIAVATTRGGNTISAASNLGIPSILPEVSGNGLWGEDGVSLLTTGVQRVMRYLGMMSSEVETAPPPKPEIVSMWVPTAPCSGLWYSHKEVTEPVEKGGLLGEIRSVFGEVLARVHSDHDGRILYRLTSLSVNEGEALLGVGTPISG